MKCSRLKSTTSTMPPATISLRNFAVLGENFWILSHTIIISEGKNCVSDAILTTRKAYKIQSTVSCNICLKKHTTYKFMRFIPGNKAEITYFTSLCKHSEHLSGITSL